MFAGTERALNAIRRDDAQAEIVDLRAILEALRTETPFYGTPDYDLLIGRAIAIRDTVRPVGKASNDVRMDLVAHAVVHCSREFNGYGGELCNPFRNVCGTVAEAIAYARGYHPPKRQEPYGFDLACAKHPTYQAEAVRMKEDFLAAVEGRPLPHARGRAMSRPKPLQSGVKHGFKVNVSHLLDDRSGYWPHPATIEQAFQTFSWMTETALNHRESGQWGASGVTEMLSLSSGVNLHGVRPIRSLDDLRARFRAAVLNDRDDPTYKAWRQTNGIHLDAVLTVPCLVSKSFTAFSHLGFPYEDSVGKLLDRLLSEKGDHEMAHSLNPVHPDCRFLHGVSIRVNPRSIAFDLTYGDKKVRPSVSSWTTTLAATRIGETFLHTLARARDVHDALVYGEGDHVDFGDFPLRDRDHIDLSRHTRPLTVATPTPPSPSNQSARPTLRL